MEETFFLEPLDCWGGLHPSGTSLPQNRLKESEALTRSFARRSRSVEVVGNLSRDVETSDVRNRPTTRATNKMYFS